MKKQSGFTLIEIAIVLVIIGLLLGGVLKGQELINSARVKNLATDFRSVPVFIYGYQDKFRALPGDDAGAVAHVNGTLATASGPVGNGTIGGTWDSSAAADESILFWQHVRLAGLAPGSTTAPTNANVVAFVPKNALGGRIGVSSTSPIITPTALRGSYYVCSEAITGQFAKQLDLTFDDGDTATGSMMTELSTAPGTSVPTANIVDGTPYIVCLAI